VSNKAFQVSIVIVALAFVVFFLASVVPELIKDFDLVGAFAAGFVNPYSSSYSADVIACWLILVIWVLYERNSLNINYGWVCVLVGIVPGVAVGFAAYLLLRGKQLKTEERKGAYKIKS